MWNRKYLISVITLCLGISISLSVYAVNEYITPDFIDDSKNITQGGLAVILIRSMGLESKLPTAPASDDYIKLLDKNGIRPLGGWESNKTLTNGDFAVILACAMGIDMRLITAQEVCEETRIYIQKMWDVQYKQDGYRENLKDLLQNRGFFPHGPPENPFGHKYTDEDSDYLVDPIVIMPGERELNPVVRYMFTLQRRGIAIEGAAERILTLRLVKKALRSPVFRSAPSHVLAYDYKEEIAEAEPYVIPITLGGP